MSRIQISGNSEPGPEAARVLIRRDPVSECDRRAGL